MQGVFQAPKPWGHVVLSVAPSFRAIFTPTADADQATFEGWEAEPRLILINEVGVRYDPFDPGAAKLLALHGLRGTVTFEPTGGPLPAEPRQVRELQRADPLPRRDKADQDCNVF